MQTARWEPIVRGALTWLFRAELAVTCTGLLLVAGALFADVLAREFFGQGIFGAQKFAVYCNAIGGLLGFAVVVHVGGHLRVAIVDQLFPDRWDARMARIGDLVSSGLCVVLGIYATKYVLSTKRLGEVDLLFFAKLWPMQLILPYIFFSSAIRYLSFAVFPALRPVEEEKH